MASYTYPSSAELKEIEQVLLPRLEADRSVFSFFPMVENDSYLLMWEQLDNYLGLQQVRGLNGQPPRVKPVGWKRYQMEPGVYGEFISLDEAQMTIRRTPGTFNQTISIDDLVMAAQNQLLNRRLDRIEQITWTLLATGTFSVTGPTGAIVHTDSYTLQTFSATVPWATIATATPLSDFRAVQLLSRGYGVSFGSDAVAYMNRATFNNFISNTNTSDLFGRRTAGLGTFNNLQSVNELLAGDDLPKIVVYDNGYLNDSNVFTLFIPNNKVVVVGKRPGNQNVGEFRLCRNVNNLETEVGPYLRVIDHGEDTVPRLIEVHDGFNGGACIYFPSAVVVMTV